MNGGSVGALMIGVLCLAGYAAAWSGVWRGWHGATDANVMSGSASHWAITFLPALGLVLLAGGLYGAVPAAAVVLFVVSLPLWLFGAFDFLLDRVPGFIEPAWARRQH